MNYLKQYIETIILIVFVSILMCCSLSTDTETKEPSVCHNWEDDSLTVVSILKENNVQDSIISIWASRGSSGMRCVDGHVVEFDNYLIFGDNIVILTKIPHQITNLKYLTEIDFSHIESLPEDLASISTLTTLRLEDSRIKTIPPVILKIKSLETLIISNDYIDTIPDELCKLTKLKCLSIQILKIKTFPQHCEELVNLEFIDISFNELSVFPEGLLTLPLKTKMSTGENRMCGAMSDAIKQNLRYRGLDSLIGNNQECDSTKY